MSQQPAQALILMQAAIELLDAAGTMRLTACHLQLAIDTYEEEIVGAFAKPHHSDAPVA